MIFGFREVKEKVMAEFAYPDLGGKGEDGSVDCPDIGEIMWSSFSASARAMPVSGRRFPDTL